MTNAQLRRARRAARAALALGLAHASVSAYWALGGTTGLDTVGGRLEDLARSREPAVVTALWGVVVVKVVCASLGVVLLRAADRSGLHRRVLLAVTWSAAIVLTLYGGAYVAGQALVAARVITSGPDADWTAIYGHLYLWDPWFLIWGLCLLLVAASAARAPRSRAGAGSGREGSPSGATRPR